MRWRPPARPHPARRRPQRPKSWPCIRRRQVQATQRDVKNGLANLERQLLAKQFEEVPGRRRRLSSTTASTRSTTGCPSRTLCTRSSVASGPSRPTPGSTSAVPTRIGHRLKALEQDGRISRVTKLVPEPEDFYCAPEKSDLPSRSARGPVDAHPDAVRPLRLSFHLGGPRHAGPRLVPARVQGHRPVGKV